MTNDGKDTEAMAQQTRRIADSDLNVADGQSDHGVLGADAGDGANDEPGQGGLSQSGSHDGATLDQRITAQTRIPDAGGVSGTTRRSANPMVDPDASEFGVHHEDGPAGTAKRLEHEGGGAIQVDWDSDH